ncbi:hypothetical protein A5781_07400 [Mycobacterium sp. 852002-30065_SCH5024008]|nr:hypothetical protein A5781_07400 [Mycobacterium sp. 852002-30065_SCH5024008]
MEGKSAITDAPVLNLIKTRRADNRHEFVDGAQPESMASEGHFGHLIRITNSEYQSSARPQHSC